MVTRITVTYEITTDDAGRTVGDLRDLVGAVITQSARSILIAASSGQAEEIPDAGWAVPVHHATIEIHAHKEATP